MKKSILGVLGLVVIVAAVVLGVKWRKASPASVASESTSPTATTTFVASVQPKVTGTAESDRDKAWAVFEKYLAAAKNHDLAALAAVSYQLSDTCKDKTKTKDCNDLMDNAYNFGQGFKKEDMTRSTGDSKQFILTNDYIESLEGDAPSITRGVIYFVRDGDSFKFLSYKPFDGAFIIRTGDVATSTIAARLKEMTKDSDGDTLTDEAELCQGATTPEDCVKTDPNKKDTNGNGWWDSTEALFYPNR